MFHHYLQVMLRNLLSHRLFSAINIFGLATALVAATLIFLFVKDETSYDTQWLEGARVARVEASFTPPGREPMNFVVAPGPAKEALKNYFSQEIEYSARINNRWPTVQVGDKIFLDEVSLVDPELQDIFHFDSVRGDIASALADASAIVLNETMAEKYFGTADPIGQVMTITSGSLTKDYTVRAVMKDLPENTHLVLQAMVPIIESDYENNPWLFNHWFSVNNHIYIKTYEDRGFEALSSRIPAFLDGNVPEGFDGATASSFMFLNFTALREIYLKGKGLGEMKGGGDINIIYAFSGIAILILVIAAINFMNLATARASQRAKEVAIRKVMGANRRQLTVQFIGESMFLTTIALFIALAVSWALLPLYNDFLEKSMVLNVFDPMLLAAAIATILLVGGAGGMYPAFVISSFRPSSVLKANKSSDTKGSVLLRNVLVVFQFSISIGLIIATAVVYMQLDYFRSLDRGYDQKGLIAIQGVSRKGASDSRDTLKQEVKSLPGVENAVLMSESPGRTNENNFGANVPGSEQRHLLGRIGVDYEFLETYKIGLLAGRGFDENRATDATPDTSQDERTEYEQGILVNETLLRKLGLGTPEEAIGKVLQRRYDQDDPVEREVLINMHIIGVLPDIHMHSPRLTIRPEVYMARDNMNTLIVRYNGDAGAIASQIEGVWNSLIPGVPFDYYVVEDKLADDFDAEARQASVFAVFAALAVIIGCLGLFGLASFVAERRTKEVGIRKIMGASLGQIVRLLLWQFSLPVIIANLIAWPVVAWVMFDWLQGFPYRIPELVLIPLSILAGVMALAIAWLTIGGHAVRVAQANPVKALRYE